MGGGIKSHNNSHLSVHINWSMAIPDFSAATNVAGKEILLDTADIMFKKARLNGWILSL